MWAFGTVKAKQYQLSNGTTAVGKTKAYQAYQVPLPNKTILNHRLFDLFQK